jgi:hypothetical protein
MVNGTYTVPIEVFDMASSSIPKTMLGKARGVPDADKPCLNSQTTQKKEIRVLKSTSYK